MTPDDRNPREADSPRAKRAAERQRAGGRGSTRLRRVEKGDRVPLQYLTAQPYDCVTLGSTVFPAITASTAAAT